MEIKLKFIKKLYVGYQPLIIEIRGEPERVQKIVDAIHKETDAWNEFEEC